MFVNSYPPEKIREVLNEFNSMISENKDSDLPHGWKGALAKRHKVPGGTMLGWIHRYGTSDKVPDSIHGNGKKNEVKNPKLPKANDAQIKNPIAATVKISANFTPPLIDQVTQLKLIIADLLLENIELRHRLREVV